MNENIYDYEQLSYGKYAYKRVQRLRRKGRRRRIDVPPLGYELTKPEKPRVAFYVIAAVSAVALIGLLIGIGFLYNELVKSIWEFNNGIVDVLKAVFDPATFALSAGLSAIPGLMIVMAYVLLIVMLLLPIGILLYIYHFIRDVIYMANCSKEEFAKGNIISSRITGLIFGIVVATAILIVLLMTVTTEINMLIWLVYGGIVLVLGCLLAFMAVEKIKCLKWFDTLDEYCKQNYLDHERALRRIKSRLKFERDVWSNFGK